MHGLILCLIDRPPHPGTPTFVRDGLASQTGVGECRASASKGTLKDCIMVHCLPRGFYRVVIIKLESSTR